MRTSLFALALFSPQTATLGSRAEAQNYPWCARYGNGFGGTNCGFTTFAQCMATVSGIGGFCQENDWYPSPRHGSGSSTAIAAITPNSKDLQH